MVAIAIASDHNGFDLKNKIIAHFKDSLNLKDYGIHNLERVDYPEYALRICDAIEDNTIKFGILICDTGIGMSIAANRKSYIRAALCSNSKIAEIARQHYDANVLVLSSYQNDINDTFLMVEKFIKSSFEGGRYSTRLNKIH
jgi:ribose 5-phosphate isomerase B